MKGIYRVNGAKSRVEKLCQAFENGKHLVELSELYPHDISNVLKLYLRQVGCRSIFFYINNHRCSQLDIKSGCQMVEAFHRTVKCIYLPNFCSLTPNSPHLVSKFVHFLVTFPFLRFLPVAPGAPHPVPIL